MAEVRINTGVERRRRWTADQKRALVAAAFAPGAVVSEVARRADVRAGQIYRWRQDFGTASRGFAEVIVSPARSAVSDSAQPMIEMVFGDNAQARIPLSTPPDLAAAVIKALVLR